MLEQCALGCSESETPRSKNIDGGSLSYEPLQEPDTQVQMEKNWIKHANYTVHVHN